MVILIHTGTGIHVARYMSSGIWYRGCTSEQVRVNTEINSNTPDQEFLDIPRSVKIARLTILRQPVTMVTCANESSSYCLVSSS